MKESSTAKISTLLLSQDTTNVQLGLELIQENGETKELLTELLVIFALSENENQSKEAKELLLQYGSEGLCAMIREDNVIAQIGPGLPIKEHKLENFAEQVGLEYWKIVAYAYPLAIHGWNSVLIDCLGKNLIPAPKAKELVRFYLSVYTNENGYFSTTFSVYKALLPYIYSVANIKFLEISVIDDISFTEDIREWKSLEELRLVERWNRIATPIKSLPTSFSELKLNKLDLGTARFETLEEELKKIAQIDTLETLSLGFHFQQFPKELGLFKQLKILRIHPFDEMDTKFKQANIDALLELEELEELSFMEFSFMDFPTDWCAALSKLKKLNLTGYTANCEVILPHNIGALSELNELTVRGKIEAANLPESLAKLTKLKCFGINGVQGEMIAAIGELVNLETLFWLGLNTKVLPVWIINLKKIKWLELNAIQICNDMDKAVTILRELPQLKKIILHRGKGEIVDREDVYELFKRDLPNLDVGFTKYKIAD